MLWEEVKEIIDTLRQIDSVRVEFCYAPHGDAGFIYAGYYGTADGDIIAGVGSGEHAFEDALRVAHDWLGR